MKIITTTTTTFQSMKVKEKKNLSQYHANVEQS